jgi:hypothetical protein
VHHPEEQSLCQRLRGLPASRNLLVMQNDKGSRAWRRALRCQGNDANGLATCQHVGTLGPLRVAPRGMGRLRLASIVYFIPIMVYWSFHERRHHVWPVYSSPMCRPAPQSSWISRVTQFLAVCRKARMVAMGPRRPRRSSRLCRRCALPRREEQPRLRQI